MAGMGKGKDNITANVESRLKSYVFLRAKQNDWTGSKMAGAIVKWWIDQGAPAVSEKDHGAADLPWQPNVKWEVLIEKEALPDQSAFPRDHPLLARHR